MSERFNLYVPPRNVETGNAAFGDFLSAQGIILNNYLALEKFESAYPDREGPQLLEIDQATLGTSPIEARQQIEGVTLYEACLFALQQRDFMAQHWIVPLATTYDTYAAPLIYMWEDQLRISVICEDMRAGHEPFHYLKYAA